MAHLAEPVTIERYVRQRPAAIAAGRLVTPDAPPGLDDLGQLSLRDAADGADITSSTLQPFIIERGRHG
jgi:hypothetical protein